MLYPHKVVIERVSNSNVRAIYFEMDDQTGAMSVMDIYEVPFHNRVGWQIAHAHGEPKEVHVPEEVDVGRAIAPGSVLQKIADHLMRQPWPAPDSPYTTRTYRGEWQIYAEHVDDQDRALAEQPVIYASFPTKVMADDHVGDYLQKMPHTSRLIPKDATHSYWRGGVRYMEVLVSEV